MPASKNIDVEMPSRSIFQKWMENVSFDGKKSHKMSIFTERFDDHNSTHVTTAMSQFSVQFPVARSLGEGVFMDRNGVSINKATTQNRWENPIKMD